MIEHLTAAGYEQTKAKLAALERRLNELSRRADLSPLHKAETQRSYEQMISQYVRELKLYEAAHPEATADR